MTRLDVTGCRAALSTSCIPSVFSVLSVVKSSSLLSGRGFADGKSTGRSFRGFGREDAGETARDDARVVRRSRVKLCAASRWGITAMPTQTARLRTATCIITQKIVRSRVELESIPLLDAHQLHDPARDVPVLNIEVTLFVP
jgi:hypothetical protein